MESATKVGAIRVNLPLAADLAHGLFLDLKGPHDGLPVLATCISVAERIQCVTDMAFADAGLAKDLRVIAFEDWLSDLVERCHDEGTRIYTFDTQLLNAAHGHPPLASRLEAILTDVKPLLREWHGQKSAKGKRREPTLADFLRHAGLAVTPSIGSPQTAQRLRYVRQQLLKHGAYVSITGTAKSKWTKLLKQGEQDCAGLQCLMESLARAQGQG